jgi:hypothetical protein
MVDCPTDKLTHGGIDALGFPREPLEALVVNQDLEASIQHAHT